MPKEDTQMFNWILPKQHAIAILKKDHDAIEDLFEEFEKAETAAAKDRASAKR